MILRNLDGILEQRGMTDDEFMEITGFNMLVALTLRAGQNCSTEVGNKVADALDVPIEDLTGEEPEVIMPREKTDKERIVSLEERVEFLEDHTYKLTVEFRKLTDSLLLMRERGMFNEPND